MADPGVLRFLELALRELGASDTRIEIGGKDPADPRIVWHGAANGWRVVALFETPPEDRTSVQGRLDSMSNNFFATVDHAAAGPNSSRTPPEITGRRLDDELGRLAERAGARGAVVFDLASPVVWGASRSSDPEADMLLEDTIVKLRDSAGELRAGHTARLPVKSEVECLARPFAGMYVLAMAFHGPLSEPSALGALLHALPVIERLVLALPPVDPPSGGAKVVRLPGPR
jgi:hypothetical protein